MNAEMLPGLDEMLGKPAGTGRMRESVAQTISAIREEGLIEPRHVGLCALALELADAVEAGRRSGRASAVAMAARELRETLQALPQPAALTARESFEAWVAAETAQLGA